MVRNLGREVILLMRLGSRLLGENSVSRSSNRLGEYLELKAKNHSGEDLKQRILWLQPALEHQYNESIIYHESRNALHVHRNPRNRI